MARQNSAAAKRPRFSIWELATVGLPGEVMLEVQPHFVARSAAENIVICANTQATRFSSVLQWECHFVAFDGLPESRPGQMLKFISSGWCDACRGATRTCYSRLRPTASPRTPRKPPNISNGIDSSQYSGHQAEFWAKKTSPKGGLSCDMNAFVRL